MNTVSFICQFTFWYPVSCAYTLAHTALYKLRQSLKDMTSLTVPGYYVML